jgi:tetratricopeptide (TPR) repeat protein
LGEEEDEAMKVRRIFVWTAFSLALALTAGKPAHAQRSPGSMPVGGVQPVEKEDIPGSSNNTANVKPASKQEEKAIKAFRNTPASDADKKTQLGEAFIDAYPQSQYRPEVITYLSGAYLAKGQVEKLQAAGDKEVALNPNNPVSLAVLGSDLSRAVNPNTPDKQKYLDQAQLYCKKSLEALEIAKKPANLSDDKFKEAKNETAATAYSGLGTVAFRNQKFTDAITDLDQSVKLGGGADPVNYYLLGKANEAATNFDAALAAYTKCAAMPGAMQAPCQASIKDVKAHGAVLPK